MSIDAFLQELFPPMPPGAMPGMDNGPANFNDRFGAMPVPMMDAPPASTGPTVPAPQDDGAAPGPSGGLGDMISRLAGTAKNNAAAYATGGIGGGDMLPPNASLTAANAPDAMSRLSGDVPLPRPRPNVEAILAGQNAQGATPMPAPGPGPQPDAAPQGNVFDRIAGRFQGWQPGGGTAVPTPADQPDNASGAMGRLMGIDADREKRIRSAIAGGFAGANPAFAGGAFMKGASGGLSGGLKSDKEDTEQSTAADERAQKQKNFERQQTEKETSGEALRKLYGQRGEALQQNAATRAAGGKAWNKPPHERYKDAMKLIQDERKAIYGEIPAFGSPKDRAAAKADADKRLKDFSDRTLKTYGIDANGNETSPNQGGAAPSGKVVGEDEGAYDNSARGQALSKARDVIARGANPEQVIAHLRDTYGITVTPDELNLGQ